jgi:hypothetical protein
MSATGSHFIGILQKNGLRSGSTEGGVTYRTDFCVGNELALLETELVLGKRYLVEYWAKIETHS